MRGLVAHRERQVRYRTVDRHTRLPRRREEDSHVPTEKQRLPQQQEGLHRRLRSLEDAIAFRQLTVRATCDTRQLIEVLPQKLAILTPGNRGGQRCGPLEVVSGRRRKLIVCVRPHLKTDLVGKRGCVVVERPTRHKEEERRGADQKDDREPRQQGTPSYDMTNEGEKCGQGKAHDEEVPQREGRDARDGRLKGEESL